MNKAERKEAAAYVQAHIEQEAERVKVFIAKWQAEIDAEPNKAKAKEQKKRLACAKRLSESAEQLLFTLKAMLEQGVSDEIINEWMAEYVEKMHEITGNSPPKPPSRH